LAVAFLMCMTPAMMGGCDIDVSDDFFEDGGFTEAIYAVGDVTTQIILVSAAAYGH
jgi:hypothetical protein